MWQYSAGEGSIQSLENTLFLFLTPASDFRFHTLWVIDYDSYFILPLGRAKELLAPLEQNLRIMTNIIFRFSTPYSFNIKSEILFSSKIGLFVISLISSLLTSCGSKSIWFNFRKLSFVWRDFKFSTFFMFQIKKSGPSWRSMGTYPPVIADWC